MPPVPTAESGSYRPYTKLAGTEPLPGYKLLEPLGRGGFGEVWKCEAPGGLLKAIKFVNGVAEDGRGEERLTQELDAFQQIKAIRHPFLLMLERVEIVANELVMVMELADRQLQDRFRECRHCGLPGIPRDELHAYFADAAEALDMIAAKFELQHLDVKPANLFLVSGHVKVGDYGLVARLDPDGLANGNRGLTPKYVAPEALRGEPSTRSDQYSLALVYYELLTGAFPYSGRTPQQLMLQHVSVKPDLSKLPPVDQPIVGRALAKNPEERFGSCLEFVQGLMSVATAASLPGAGMNVRRARVERSMVEMDLPTAEPLDAAEQTGNHSRVPGELTQNFTVSSRPSLTALNATNPSLPRLVTSNRQPTAQRAPQAPALTPGTPAPNLINTPRPTERADRYSSLTLDRIRSVLPFAKLIGLESNTHILTPAEFARAVVDHAAAGAHIPLMPGDMGRLADGTCVCQFPSTVTPAVVPFKLGVVRETWGVSLEQPEPTRLILRKAAPNTGFWGSLSSKKPSGFEIIVQIPPPGRGVGEVTVTSGLYGTPDREFVKKAQDAIPRMIAEVRRELKNVDDRRKHPRVSVNFGVTLYPMHSDGGIDTKVVARCRDVSLGGLAFASDTPLPTKYAYALFDSIEPVSDQAILVKVLRTLAVGRECVTGCEYRVDL